jgi:hypothetical protein
VKKLVDANAKTTRIREKGRNIAEHDTFVRKIHDGANVVPDGLLPIVHGRPYVWC